ncbi:tyrosine-type recombinase/integrase [Azospirillum argentinense]|uniref:Site-specific integrase n=1 Tax=Azospirillum brasilense TaxID=192 RepID=A0A4D8QAJ9_AZOBR|nr:site-specific integrase [Azospirillum argentinense]QCO04229.1 site-specific integrase [Azospirillum argentinense]
MPKRNGRHPEKALTAVSVRTAKPGRHADGNGLYLEVDPSGARRWLLRLVIQGKRRDIGLGSATLVTLSEARDVAYGMRKVARAGGDPLADRRAARRVVPTFEEAARSCHGEHKDGWKNDKHAAQWLSTLETYVFPLLGPLKMDVIGTPEVRDVLLPIWLEKPETARRVRQRIGTVLDWAATKGYREGENPVRSVTKGLPKQKDDAEHFTALPYVEVPAFLSRLRETNQTGPVVKLAMEFLILTAVRSGEMRNARWSEIDVEAKLWTIPGPRMKAGKPHVVPLAPRAVAILKAARGLARKPDDPDALVFEGSKAGKPMSDMTLTMLLRRLEMKATAHGFRSSFRDWCAEATNFPREVAEAALAHALESKVEAAYRRSDLLEKRRKMMEAWARHCESAGGKVTPRTKAGGR